MQSLRIPLAVAASLVCASSAFAQQGPGSWERTSHEEVGRHDIAPVGNGYDSMIRPPFPNNSPFEPRTTYPYTLSRYLIIDGFFSTTLPGNHFFADFPYSLDCQDPSLQLLPPSQGVISHGWYDPPTITPIPAVNACSLKNAPVVDMQWVRNNLDAGGYLYGISYPAKDFGNGRALVSWIKGCRVQQPNPAYWDGSYCYAGVARLEGAGWQTQFPADLNSVSVPLGAPGRNYKLSVISGFPQASRDASLMMWHWPTSLYETGPASPLSPSYRIWTDSWLSEIPPPKKIEFPPIPPYADADAPGAVNIGAVSDGVGTGATTPGATTPSGAIPFDYEAFCNSPSSDGKPRSPLWTQNCLGARQ